MCEIPIAGFTRPRVVSVAPIYPAAACRRPSNPFFPRILPLLLAGTLRLGRFHACKPGKLRKWYEREGAQADRHRYEP